MFAMLWHHCKALHQSPSAHSDTFVQKVAHEVWRKEGLWKILPHHSSYKTELAPIKMAHPEPKTLSMVKSDCQGAWKERRNVWWHRGQHHSGGLCLTSSSRMKQSISWAKQRVEKFACDDAGYVLSTAVVGIQNVRLLAVYGLPSLRNTTTLRAWTAAAVTDF